MKLLTRNLLLAFTTRWARLISGWAGPGVLLGLSLGLLAPGRVQAQAPAWQWGESLPTDAKVAADSRSRLYVTGSFQDSISLGGTTLRTATTGGNDYDVYVGCYDAVTRRWLWAVRVGGSGEEATTAVAVNNQGQVFVTGYYDAALPIGSTTLPASTTQNMFIAALDASTGAWQWARYGSGSLETYGFALTTDTSGHVFVGGTYNSPQGSTFGPLAITTRTGVSSFIARLAAATGTWEWLTAAGGFATSLALDAAGHLYAGGSYDSFSATFGTTQLVPVANSADAYIGLLDAATGTWQWAVSAGGPDHDAIASLATDAQGQVYAVGSFSSATATFGATTLVKAGPGQLVDGFIARLDPATRRWQWATAATGSGTDALFTVCTDAAGGVYALGASYSPQITAAPLTFATTSGSTFVLRFDPATGAAQWVLQADMQPGSLAFDAAGFGYVTGISYGTLNFGNGLVAPSALAQLQPGGARLPTATQAATASPLLLAPNPAHGSTTLTLPAAPTAQPLTLLDALGRPVRHYTVPAGATTAPLDVTGLPAGLYVLHGAGASRKLVLQ